MSLRRKLIFGLISLICFSVGVTATVLLSPGRDFKSVLPQVHHGRQHAYYYGRSNYDYNIPTTNVDEMMANGITAVDGMADQQTLDHLKLQVDRLETTGRAFLGV